MKCPYYSFERNILVNRLNNIGVNFELETLLRRKIQYSYKWNCEVFPLFVNLFNPQRDFSGVYKKCIRLSLSYTLYM